MRSPTPISNSLRTHLSLSLCCLLAAGCGTNGSGLLNSDDGGSGPGGPGPARGPGLALPAAGTGGLDGGSGGANPGGPGQGPGPAMTPAPAPASGGTCSEAGATCAAAS